MTQTTTRHPRDGWQQDEIDTLFEAVRDASAIGRPLRNVFEDVGERLSRKPNSIRNFYYARVRETPQLAPSQPAFRAFDEEELHALLREVLMGRAQGESVRACVTRLACGDRSGMLRYQNKYRSILKNKPAMLLAVAEELRAEGLPCPDDVLACRSFVRADAARGETGALGELSARMGDPVMKKLVGALCELARRGDAPEAPAEPGEDAERLQRKWLDAQRECDRLRVEVDLLKLALEDAREGAPVE